jgi:hypothetical protein
MSRSAPDRNVCRTGDWVGQRAGAKPCRRAEPDRQPSAPLARFVKARKPLPGAANPPLRRRPGCTSNRSSNRPARNAVRCQQHDPRPLPQPVLRLRRTRQALKLSDPVYLNQRDQLARLELQYRIPTVNAEREAVVAGSLAS